MAVNVGDQRMFGVQNQGCLRLEHIVVDGHAVHLHHIAHAAAFLGKRDDRCHGSIFQIFCLYGQLVVGDRLAEQLLQILCLFLQSLAVVFILLFLQIFGQIRINSAEAHVFVLLLYVGDERRIDVMLQDHRVLALRLEHVDVLALLDLVGHIEDGDFFLFLLFFGLFFFLLLFAALCSSLFLILFFGLLFFLCLLCRLLLFRHILVDAVLQRQEFAVDVLIQDVIHHPVGELFILQASEFDKRADIIPVFLVILAVGLKHAGELVRHLLGDVVGNFLDKSVVLQRASGNIQRKIRTVDDALQEHQILRNDLLDVIGDEHLVVVQLDFPFDGIILRVDPREIQDSLQAERIIHIQMNPEQRLLVIQEYVAVEFLVLLVGAFAWLFGPQRMDIADGNRTFLDFHLVFGGRNLNLLFFALVVFLFLVFGVGVNMLNDLIVFLQIGFRNNLRLRGGSLFGQEDLYRHKGAVFFQRLADLVLVCVLQAVLVQMKRDGGSDFFAVSGSHGVLGAAVALPVHRFRAFLEGKRINIHLVSDHECGIEAQSEVSDDLILIRLVLIFLQEFCRAGKSDVRDILYDLFRGHADTVINKLQCLFLIIDQDVYFRLVAFRKFCLSDGIQFFSLGYGITAVGNQLTDENILIRVHPFFDNGKNIVAVNGKISAFCLHMNHTPLSDLFIA